MAVPGKHKINGIGNKHRLLLTIVHPRLQQLSRLLQGGELLPGEEGVVGALPLLLPRRPRRHRHRPQVEVVPDGVLEVVVGAALGEAGVQVLAEVGRDRAWRKNIIKMLVKYFVSYINTVESISPILFSNIFKIISPSISPIFNWCPDPHPHLHPKNQKSCLPP